MEKTAGEDPPPKPTDLVEWRQAVKDDRYLKFPLEAIVAAIQDLGPTTDKSVLNPLAKHLSDSVLKMLRKWVGTNRPNRGEDIIEHTHDKIFDAVLNPESADGKGLREAFTARVKYRLIDILASERRKAAVIDSTVEIQDGQPLNGVLIKRSSQPNNVRSVDEKLDTEIILEKITDPKKRLAFRLFMDGVPFKSKKSDSIEKALDISEKTARQWIKEAQDLLSSNPTVQRLLESAMGDTP